MAGNKLEEAAKAARESLITKNTYNDADDSRNYGSTHTRALSDSQTPVYGKGTGVFLDTYNGGSSVDVNGAPDAVGSGRIGNVVKNQYDKDKIYVHPDTSGNVGQFRFHS